MIVKALDGCYEEFHPWMRLPLVVPPVSEMMEGASRTEGDGTEGAEPVAPSRLPTVSN